MENPHRVICFEPRRVLRLGSKRCCQFWWQPSGATLVVALGSQRLSSSKGQNSREGVTQRDRPGGNPLPPDGCSAEGVDPWRTHRPSRDLRRQECCTKSYLIRGREQSWYNPCRLALSLPPSLLNARHSSSFPNSNQHPRAVSKRPACSDILPPRRNLPTRSTW
jgi:hypothetical protein